MYCIYITIYMYIYICGPFSLAEVYKSGSQKRSTKHKKDLSMWCVSMCAWLICRLCVLCAVCSLRCVRDLVCVMCSL